MADLEFASDAGRGQAMLRAADALLRTLGPTGIILVLPTDAAQSNADLGLGTPLVEQVELTPAVVRPLADAGGRRRIEILLSASTVAAQAELRGYESAEALFNAAVGVVHGGRLLRVESVGSDSFAGTSYLYRVTASD
jgi:hypothetical protein